MSEGTMNNIFPILFSGLLTQFMILIGLRWALMHRLKMKEPKTWEALGKPKVVIPFDDAKISLRIIKYLIRGDYRSSDDKLLIRLAGCYRLLAGAYLIYFVCTVVIFIYLSKK